MTIIIQKYFGNTSTVNHSWFCPMFDLLYLPILGRITATVWRQLLRARYCPPPFPLQEKTLGVCIPYSIFSYSSARLFASPSYWFGRITASWPNHQNFNKNLFQPATSWLTYRRSQTGLKTGPRLWASYSRWLLIFYPFLRGMFIKKFRARQALQRLPLG